MEDNWKKRVCNCEGDIIREKVETELERYDDLLKKVKIVYQYITNGECTDPFTKVEHIFHYIEMACSRSYDTGFDTGYEEGKRTTL
jgi:translation initiation factor 2 beta subunit (eIF-2beta)/eIF-5